MPMTMVHVNNKIKIKYFIDSEPTLTAFNKPFLQGA